MARGAGRPAVFLDRDGTINVEIGYLGDPERMVLLPGAAEAIARLNSAGFTTVIVTNQAGIARGYFNEQAMHAIHQRMARELARVGATIDAFLFCPHHPDFTGPCACRKPEPGMLLRAAAELGLDLRRSWLVGDTANDIRAGAAAGCRTILVRTGYGAEQECSSMYWPDGLRPDYVADDLAAAADLILCLSAANRRED